MKQKLQPLLSWLKTADEKGVSETGTTRAYLRLIGYRQKTASAEMAVGIERATSGLVTRQMLRPDDWRRLWPELAELAATMEQTIPANSHSGNSTEVAVYPSSKKTFAVP